MYFKPAIFAITFIFILSAMLLKFGTASAAEIKTVNDLYYKGIIPGETMKDAALKIMGAQDKTRENPDKTTSFIFDSKKVNFPHELTFDASGKLVHMAITVLDTNELNISQVKKVIGEPERKGFTLLAFYHRVHAYPKHGMVYICNENGAVEEKQYFIKCDLTQFEAKFGKRFPKESPYKM